MAEISTENDERQAICDMVAAARDRLAMLRSLEETYNGAKAVRRRKEQGQGSLFDVAEDEATAPEVVPVTGETILAVLAALNDEMETVQMYVSGHPLLLFGPAVRRMKAVSPDEALDKKIDEEAWVAGRFLNLKERRLKAPNRQGLTAFAAWELEGYTADMRVICWPEAFENYKKVIRGCQFGVVKGVMVADNYRGSVQLAAREVIAVTTEDAARAYHSTD